MTEKRFTLQRDSEWWLVGDNTIKVNENGYREDLTGEDKYRGLEQDLTEQEVVDLLNKQDQRIKELEEQLKLVCEADCVTPHDSVKEILRDEIKGIDTVAGESAMAWHDYCVLDKVFREQYDNELWDNYDD